MATTISDCGVKSVVGLDFPIYVRKLARKRHWRDSDEDTDARLGGILSDVFREASMEFSFYKASCDKDFQRIAIGLNSNRSSLVEEIHFVAFTDEEIKKFGSTKVTVGDTRCDCANQLHVDISFTNEDLALFCEGAINANRKASKLSKSKMVAIRDATICVRLGGESCQ